MKERQGKTSLKNFELNLRWGRLLLEERERLEVGRDALARQFGLDPREIDRWESGFGSPVACVFHEIISFLGAVARRRACCFWLDLQHERNFGEVVEAAAAFQRKNNYAALGAIRRQHGERAVVRAA